MWIAGCGNWQPGDPADVPPRAVALELAEEETMSAEQAKAYVVAFNRTVLRAAIPNRWAVAVPVAIVYRGDANKGKVLVVDSG